MFFKGREKKKFQKDYEEAQNALERMDLALSSRLMRPWSDKGFVEATLHLQKVMQVGEMISAKTPQGEAMRKEYHRMAVEFVIKAADQGDTISQFNSGVAYEFPESYGWEQNYSKAFHYYKLAADKGDGNALNNLGCLYQFGTGVERDYEKAKELYQKAIEAGNPRGLMVFGYMYKCGKGVTADLCKAKDYMYAAKVMAEEKLYKAKYEGDLCTVFMQEKVLGEIVYAQNRLEEIYREMQTGRA